MRMLRGRFLSYDDVKDQFLGEQTLDGCYDWLC